MATAMAVFFYLLAGPVIAEEARYYKIEAAFLYNFFNYITWPGYTSPEALTQPTVCLDGNDPVAPYLGYIQQKMAGKRGLLIRKLHEGEAMTGCHMFFLRRNITPAMTQEAFRTHTLIVSELDDPLDRGGVIALAKEDERILMDINQSLLTENGFQISSRLLDLAQKVR